MNKTVQIPGVRVRYRVISIIRVSRYILLSFFFQQFEMAQLLNSAEFINAVRERPGLWNTAIDDYRDQQKKDCMWEEVAQQFQTTSGKLIRSNETSYCTNYINYLKELNK